MKDNYRSVVFKNTEELKRYLNSKDIKKDNIISVLPKIVNNNIEYELIFYNE